MYFLITQKTHQLKLKEYKKKFGIFRRLSAHFLHKDIPRRSVSLSMLTIYRKLLNQNIV